MSRPLANDWNEYETQVLPTCSGDRNEIQGVFLAGASSMLATLYEALQERPDQREDIFLEYSREIRTLLEPRPGKGKL